MRNWIIGIILAAMVLNIGALYYLYYQLNNRVDAQSSNVERIVVQKSSAEVKEKEEDQKSETESTQEVTSCTLDCKSEIERLEGLIAKITPGTSRVIQSAPVSSSSHQSVKEITVALGSGQVESSEWVDVSGANAWIDSTNYKGIQSVTFEGSLQVPTANGWVTARLYNKSEEHPVWSSEISAEESTPQLRYSGEITLGNGNNLYQVQLKNSLGALSLIESARVKILLK